VRLRIARASLSLSLSVAVFVARSPSFTLARAFCVCVCVCVRVGEGRGGGWGGGIVGVGMWVWVCVCMHCISCEYEASMRLFLHHLPGFCATSSRAAVHSPPHPLPLPLPRHPPRPRARTMAHHESMRELDARSPGLAAAEEERTARWRRNPRPEKASAPPPHLFLQARCCTATRHRGAKSLPSALCLVTSKRLLESPSRTNGVREGGTKTLSKHSTSHWQLGSLSHPQDLDGPMRVAAQRKTNAYRQTYANNQNISFLPAIMSTSNRMHREFLRLLFLQAHRETKAHAAGMPSQRNQSESFRFKRAAFYQGLKSKVVLAAAKSAALRINLNVQGCSIVAAPMHAPSRTSLLLPLLLSHNLPLPRVH
jgi:hypothetical protein